MENKPAQATEPTLQESEALVTPAQAVEVTETPEQTAEKVEVTTSSVDTLAKKDAEKPGFGLKFRKGLMKAAAVIGIGGGIGALAGGTALNNETAPETPNPEAGTSETLTAKDPSQDILVNPGLPNVLIDEAKDPSLDINANPNLPESLRVVPPVSAPESSTGTAGGESAPSPYASPITPEAATSIPTFPAVGEDAQVYTIPTPDTSNNNLGTPLPPPVNEGIHNGPIPMSLETPEK